MTTSGAGSLAVQVLDLHQRVDLREEEVPKVEDVPCPALLDQLPALPAQLELGLTHSVQAGVNETRMMEPFSVRLEVLVVDAATAVRRDEFVGS